MPRTKPTVMQIPAAIKTLRLVRSLALLARNAAPAMNKRPPMAPMINPISPMRLAVSAANPMSPMAGRVAPRLTTMRMAPSIVAAIIREVTVLLDLQLPANLLAPLRGERSNDDQCASKSSLALVADARTPDWQRTQDRPRPA